MDNFKTLLVGLDLTESDSLLLRYTASFCSQVGSIEKVYFVHNIKIGYDSEELALFSELERPIEEIIAEELEERVERFFEISQPAINYEVLVTKQSYTPTALAQLATKQDADLILMEKRPLTGDPASWWKSYFAFPALKPVFYSCPIQLLSNCGTSLPAWTFPGPPVKQCFVLRPSWKYPVQH